MFRVMIADDESSVIQSLTESVQWQELELEIAGTASDGSSALALAREKNVDIAILDIRMPGINGLELCERLRRENEQIQLIIISGYAEFAYAEKAIQYGVIGYCLKPLEYMQVSKHLGKAVQNLKLLRHMAVKEDLIEILERRDDAEIRECLGRLGFSQGSCYVAVSTGEKRPDGLCGEGISLRIGRGQWGYLLENDRLSRSGGLYEKEEGWLGIGYMKEPVEAGGLYGALEECSARAYQFFVEEHRCICADLEETGANVWLERVREAIRGSRWESVAEILKEIERSGIHDFTVRSSLRLCNMIFSSSLFQSEGNDSYIYSIKQLVMEYGSLKNMLNLLGEEIGELREAEKNGEAFSNAAFMKLLRYVNKNYKGDISLSGAAKALYMNPNYISQLFKKEAGVTFVHYINQKRVEDAKELLVMTQKPVTDIAIEVGFNDYFYFIKTFKKFTGITPGQYRSQN